MAILIWYQLRNTKIKTSLNKFAIIKLLFTAKSIWLWASSWKLESWQKNDWSHDNQSTSVFEYMKIILVRPWWLHVNSTCTEDQVMEAPFLMLFNCQIVLNISMCPGRFHVDGLWIDCIVTIRVALYVLSPTLSKFIPSFFFIYKVLILISSEDLIWGVLHLTYIHATEQRETWNN